MYIKGANSSTGLDLGAMRHKLLPFENVTVKATSDKADIAGEIEGFAAGILNIDRGSDLIFPGAFEELGEFKEEGVVAYQHDYSAPIGRPLEVEERLAPDYGLWTRAEIVGTTLGTDVMKLVRTKVLKKLSIGYRILKDGYAMLNREALVATLTERAIAANKVAEILADFDRRKLEVVWGLFKIKLYEYSVVTRPMNPNAAITGAKELEEGVGLLDGLPFSYHPSMVLAAVRGYASRLKESHTLYAQKDRGVSGVHAEGIKAIREALELTLTEVRDVEGLVTAKSYTDEELISMFADNEARLLGIPLLTVGG